MAVATFVPNRAKLRRVRILQALSTSAPAPLGQRAMLASLQADRDLEPTPEKLRADAEYLAAHGLVRVIRDDDSDWIALDLTKLGQTWLRQPGDHGLAIYSPGEVPEIRVNHLGRTSSIQALPPELRAWLDQELVRLGFRDYSGLAAALAEKGWEISRSAVHRYGRQLKAVIKERQARAQERAEIARALSGVYGTDTPAMLEGALGTALTRVMDAIDEGAYNPDNDSLAGLVKAIPSLGKGFADAEKQRIERQARKAALQEAAERVDKAAAERGLSEQDARFWRERVLMGM